MIRTNEGRRAVFERYGRAYHLRIECAADLRIAGEIDPALWAAVSMPTRGLSADAAFLSHVDADANGRITHAEVCAAIAWLFEVLESDAPVNERRGRIESATFRAGNPVADRIRGIFERMSSEPSIGLEDIRKRKAEIAAHPVSATGIVLPEAAEDPELAETIRLAISVSGGTEHPSGSRGLDAASLDRFLSMAERFRALSASEASIETDISIYRRFTGLFDKLDEYYELCARRSIGGAEVAGAPTLEGDTRPLGKIALARPEPDGVLRINSFVNPVWQAALESFRSELLPADSSTISAVEWQRLRKRFAESRRVAEAFEQIGIEALGAFRGSSIPLDRSVAPEIIDRIRALIGSAAGAALTVEEVALLERLALYQVSLIDLAANFVAFSRLYDLTESAWLEMGRLVLDGRTFHLAVLVENRAKHVAAAKNSSMFVLYLQVRRARDVALYEIAVPVTAGGRGNLAVGKRGIFIDRDGLELDAEILEIIDNPISVTEAIVSPIRRLGKTISGKIESITTTADKDLQQYAGTAVETIGSSSHPVAVPQPPVQDNRGRIGTALLGGSVAVAAIGTALAYVTSTLSSMNWWHILAGLGAAVVAVVLPAILLAMMKIRARDLSAVVEASGWALNVRMRLNRRLSRLFTARGLYPRDARGTPGSRRRRVVIGLLAILAAVAGIALILVYLSQE